MFFLSLAQIFSMTMNINIITTGLAGFIIAPYGWLSTFPLSLQFIITMLFTFLFNFNVKIWQKNCFCRCLIGFNWWAYNDYSFISKNFYLFCFGSVLLGIGHATNLFIDMTTRQYQKCQTKSNVSCIICWINSGSFRRIYRISAGAILYIFIWELLNDCYNTINCCLS